jgi:hypothetical protein
MNRNTLARLEKLESAGSDRQRPILAAYDHDEALKLERASPGALVVVTGVPRAHNTGAAR